jgi:biopolymer transport protein ExbD
MSAQPHPALKIPEALAAAEPEKARLEIIPLIDVIFFLLATFVLFTLTLQKIRFLELKLPVAGREGSTPANLLFLQATEAGACYR